MVVSEVKTIDITSCVISRGCSFVTKCLNVELSGAVAAIITDNNPDDNMQWIEMVQDETDRLVGIPSYFMLGKDG